MPKPLLLLGDRPLIEHSLDAALAARDPSAPVVVVASDERVAAAVSGRPGVVVVRNPAPERGIASSLQAVLHTLEPRADVDAVVVGLADQPLVGAGAYRRLAAAHADGAMLAYATYDGVRANPVLVARRYWEEALALVGDEGARALFSRYPAVAVPCDGTGTPDDVDTPEDLVKVESRWRSQIASE